MKLRTICKYIERDKYIPYFLKLGRNLSQFSFASVGSFASSLFSMRVCWPNRMVERGNHQILKYKNRMVHTKIKTPGKFTSMVTLILNTGCCLFNMQSSTTLLTCLRPLNVPIAETVYPCAFTNSKKLKGLHYNKKKKEKGCIRKIPPPPSTE